MAVNHAFIDKELFLLLKSEESRYILLQAILDCYFPGVKNSFNLGNNNIINEIENQISEDPEEKYSERINKIKRELDNDSFQEEVFVRSNIFKLEVPKAYNYSCSISRLRVDSIINVSMIDACHITPFSESYNDTISNGIALCPNLHRAFDRGLIAISDDYTVLVNKNFSEENKSNYSIRQFEGIQILLPHKEKHYPSKASLRNHRERYNF